MQTTLAEKENRFQISSYLECFPRLLVPGLLLRKLLHVSYVANLVNDGARCFMRVYSSPCKPSCTREGWSSPGSLSAPPQAQPPPLCKQDPEQPLVRYFQNIKFIFSYEFLCESISFNLVLLGFEITFWGWGRVQHFNKISSIIITHMALQTSPAKRSHYQ